MAAKYDDTLTPQTVVCVGKEILKLKKSYKVLNLKFSRTDYSSMI